MNLGRLAPVWLAVCLVLAATSVPAEARAAVSTSTGVRCTIVGTSGPDVLRGTRRSDVICGRGGDDRIYPGPGSDVVDAGAGNDLVRAEDGHDTVLGGSGDDQLYGGLGDDRIDGGSGKDFIRADSGADRVRGGTDADRVQGDSGNDRVTGDGGDDVLSGGNGDDVVTGEVGDDELSGGRGGDDADGGSGFNVCDEPGGPADSQVRCVVDVARPVVGEVTVLPAIVDVTEADQVALVRVHVTDDTGVKRVQVATSFASLESGTPLDGIWAATVVVPRFVRPGPRDVDLYVTDRVGRSGSSTAEDAYVVENATPDVEMPELRSLSLSRDLVDVRTAAWSITGTAAWSITGTAVITDDLAGAGRVFLCPAHEFPTGEPHFRQAGSCVAMEQASGDRTSSTWEATYVVPEGAVGGTWNFSVWVYDAADDREVDYWFGPDELAAQSPATTPWCRPIPDGGGVFTVVGADQDLDPPALTSLRLSSNPVDTAHGAVRVTAEISAADRQGVTATGLFISGYPGYPDHQDWADRLQIAWVENFELVRGTARDGVWRATFVVPGGTPDGSYFVQAVVRDAGHYESWATVADDLNHVHGLTPELAPTGTSFVVRNS